MIEIQIGKENIKLEEELTIRKYYKLRDINNINNPVNFLSTLTGISPDLIRKSKKKDIDFIYGFLIDKYLTIPQDKIKTTFDFNGITYGLNTDISQFNFGSWVDLEMVIAEGVDNNIHKIMAIMYRPVISQGKNGNYVIEEYDGNDLKDRSELFMDLPFSYWLSVNSFFLLYITNYSKIIKSSLELKKKRMKNKEIAMRRLKKMRTIIFHPFKMLRDFIGTA